MEIPKWSPEWGWEPPAPRKAVIPLATHAAMLGAVTLAAAALALIAVALVGLGGWGDVGWAFSLGFIGSAAIEGSILHQYHGPDAERRGDVAPLPTDAQRLRSGVDWRVLAQWLLFSSVLAAAMVPFNGARVPALLAGAGAGGIALALVERYRDRRREQILYVEAGPRLLRREKPRCWLGHNI